MLKSYLKIALRNLMRYKGYTLINIFGLSIGLSCSILIMLFIRDELSYDRFHEKAENIYRIVSEFSENGKLNYTPSTPAPLAGVLRNEYSEVLQVTRIGSGRGDMITYGDIQTRGNRFMLADPSIFDVFTIPFVEGNPKNALNDINSVIISKSLAEKYFGNKDPIGKILQIGKEDYNKDYKVSGVFKNLPSNSSLKFDCLASFENEYVKGNEGNLRWGANHYVSFILLHDGCVPQSLESKLSSISDKYVNDVYKSGSEVSKTKYLLQPLASMYLSLDPGNKLPTEKDSIHIFVFAGIALLMLLIACINFMNLATARASMREKEVGIRKVIGANRFQLIKQFLGESIILSMFAYMLSIPIVEILLPVFNQYTDKQLFLLQADNTLFLVGMLILSFIVGVFAGSYPALFISSFKPVSILRGRLFSSITGIKIGLRRLLVVIQFVISIIFVVCTLVIHNQLRYVKNKNLGYDKEHLVVVPIHDHQVKLQYKLYETEIMRSANILNATATSYLPSEQEYYQNVDFKDSAIGSMEYMSFISVDQNFIETMGLKLLKGGNFHQDYLPGGQREYILNESAVKEIGWENPLGEQIDIINWGTVIGVVKDFNFKSLYHQVKPMALCIYPEGFKYLLIRVKPDNISNSIHFLENKWEEINPNQIFAYSFFDEDFNRVYKADIRLDNIFNFIAALALIIACLGLFGMVHFSTERRTKEIGIRKVFGSNVLDIVVLLTKDFVKWILIANIIAWPVAYYFMNKWLQDFAYRINIAWWMFILSGGIALLIALATVSYQATKAALANPVESLKYE